MTAEFKFSVGDLVRMINPYMRPSRGPGVVIAAGVGLISEKTYSVIYGGTQRIEHLESQLDFFPERELE